MFNTAAPTPEVLIENYGDKPVTILSAEIPEDTNLKPTLTRNSAVDKPCVRITAPQGYQFPRNVELVIKTDDPDIKEIRVAVYTIRPQNSLPPMPPKSASTQPATNRPPVTAQPASGAVKAPVKAG